MTVTVCLPATKLISIDAMASVETSVILTTGADRPMSNVPTQLTAFEQTSKLMVPRDTLSGVVSFDGERASLI